MRLKLMFIEDIREQNPTIKMDKVNSLNKSTIAKDKLVH